MANKPDRKNCHVVNTVLKYAHVNENFPKSSTDIFSKVWADTTKTDLRMTNQTNFNIRKGVLMNMIFYLYQKMDYY